MTDTDIEIDHTLYGGRDLDALVESFSSAGMEPVAGGEHQHDVTHNALLGFDDGTYIELIAPRDPTLETNVRNAFFQGDAGPCGWAVAVDDIDAEVNRFRAGEIPVDGPEYHKRETPDGEMIEWEVAYPGGGEPGRTLPFLIEDHTPRHRRIQPSPSVSGTPLAGIAEVVIGVDDLESIIDRFQRTYGLEGPDRGSDDPLDLEYASFSDLPALLTTPTRPDTWLADRVDRFGSLPWGILVGTTSFGETTDRYGLTDVSTLAGRRVAWFPLDSPTGGRVGVVEQ